MTQLAFYLPAGEDTAMCLFHGPPADVEPGVGVVLCPPLGWDEVSSYRTRRQWADALAAAGHPTVRLDLPSTGDSTGSTDDPGRADAWTAAIVAAAEWLRTLAGCERVALLGLGVGGLLACRAMSQGAPADDLVLWGTPARGRSAVRELRALSRLEAAEFEVPEAEVAAAPDDAYLESGGFAFTAETVTALEALEVAGLELAAPDRARRALLLGRDRLRVDQKLRAHLESCGLELTEAAGEGWSLMAPQEPPEAQLPANVVQTVAVWLAAAPSGGTAAAAEPAVTPELDLPERGIREVPFTIARPYGRMFGVLTEPAVVGENPSSDPEVVAVLLNAGVVRRTGPNRMWVEIARRWASRGVVTLRIDLEGIGDADGDEHRYTDVGQLYEPHLVAEARAALRALREHRPHARFVVLGLCSGAYWAFHAARDEPGVAAVVMLNPRQLFYDPAIDVRREAQLMSQSMSQARGWRRALTGRVPLGLILRRARSYVVSLVQARAHRRLMHRTARQIEQGFDELRDGGVSSLLVFSEGEPLLDELREEDVLAHADRWPTLEVEIIRGPGHTFRPVWSQQRVHDRLDETLEAVLATQPGGARDAPLGAPRQVGR